MEAGYGAKGDFSSEITRADENLMKKWCQ